MSLAFDDPRIGPNATFAGGEASLGDIAAAAVDQMLYVDNTLASRWALDRAVSERNDEVFAATGVRPGLPRASLRTGTDAWRPDAPDAMDKWRREIETAAARIPDQNVVNRLTRPIEGDAIRIARASDDRLARLMASRGGVGKWVAAFAGGAWGSMADPINVLSMLIGAGPGAGRTVASRILATTTREAAINGATEAAMQPMVQAWREKAGLDHGARQALGNIGFAAAFGGAFGAAGQALGEGLTKLSGRALDAAGEAAAADPRVSEKLRRTMQGDVAAARETLPEIREALPADARGALDHAEILDHLDATRPGSASLEHNDVTVSAAHRAVERQEPPRFEADPAQVERITRNLAGEAPVGAPSGRSLTEFLKDIGGVLDQNGELTAIGAGDLARKGKSKDRRVPLDTAREMAEEAGYIGRAGETQTTTVADLLDAVDTEKRGNRIFAREDASPATSADFEAQRAGVERTVAEIAAHAGPAVDDRIIREAAELAIGEGIDPFDALESVLIRAEQAPDRLGIELPDLGVDLFKADIRDAKKAAGAFAKEHFGGRSIVNRYDSSAIRISSQGIKHTLSRKPTRAALAALTRLDELIETARPAGVAEDRGGRNTILRVHYYEREIAAGGSNARIRVVVRETPDGKLYYDHSEVLEGGSGPGGGRSLQDDGPGEGRAEPPDTNIARPAHADNPLPGWSDEELLAASAARGPEPTADRTPFFDPGDVDPALTLTANDISEFGDTMLPGAGGGPRALRALVDDIKHGEGLAAIVKACKA